MTDEKDAKLNFVKVEAKGFQDLCDHYKELEERNRHLERLVGVLKSDNRNLTDERNALLDELHHIKRMGMFEFADKYCNDDELEDAGHQLARSLGVGQ